MSRRTHRWFKQVADVYYFFIPLSGIYYVPTACRAHLELSKVNHTLRQPKKAITQATSVVPITSLSPNYWSL